MLKISIPKPCKEDWDAMTPNEQGRHCKLCAKTVTDFTMMTDEDIKQYFITKKEEAHICGRFKNEQLHRIVIDLPENILYVDMQLWKKFLVACLISFSTILFSCDTTINGKQPTAAALEKNIIPLPVPLDMHSGYVGGLLVKWDSITIPNFVNPISIPVKCNVTYGFTVTVPADTLKIDSDPPIISIQDSTLLKTQKKSTDSLLNLKTDSAVIKNPPKADSIDCNKQTYY